MTVHGLPGAREFLDVAAEQLLADEIQHNLAYGIATRLAADEHAYGPETPWFIVVRDAVGVCAAALRTPPHGVILSYFRGEVDEVCELLVRSIHNMDSWIPGVVGERSLADRFTQRWCAVYRRSVKEVMAQRIYRLTDVARPRFSPGGLREATIDEIELVESWSRAFLLEASGKDLGPSQRKQVRELILGGTIHVWDNRGPVSIAAGLRPTLNGIGIGLVYTPPEHRSLGYATSCVASLCEKLLREYRFCMLYTDLSNPVSNSIYKRIGFKEYCDSAQYTYNKKPV